VIWQIAVSGALGIAGGTLAGFLGLGGGSLLPPLLGVLLGVDQHLAQGISLAALLPPVGLPAVIAYRRAGIRIDARLVVLAIVGFLVGVTAGAFVAHRVPAHVLRLLFAAFLVVSAWRALARPPRDEAPASDAAPRRGAGLFVGALGGALSGLLGVGGGIVLVPLLRKAARLGRLEAQATTLALTLPPIGLPAVLVYAREQGGLPWELLAAVALGFSLGTWMGARLAGKVSDLWAARTYAAMLLVVAGVLVLHT
jgi:uncharacterized membrane protein YfcA